MTRTSRVVGVMIIYYPDLDSLYKNIQVASSQVDSLYIWDNTGLDSQVGHSNFPENVVYIQRQGNEGISVPLNRVAKIAQESGAEWLLTLDQDTTLPESYVDQLLEALCQIDSLESVGIVAGLPVEPYKGQLDVGDDGLVKVQTLITSGCLVRLSAFEQTGGADEQMFIVCVDHELCLKMRRYGFNLYLSRGVRFEHTIGKPKVLAIPKIGISVRCSNHVPLRKYYSTRNRISLYRKNFLFDPKYVIKDLYSAFAEVAKIVLFEDQKLAKLRAIGLGLEDAIAGKGGACSHLI